MSTPIESLDRPMPQIQQQDPNQQQVMDYSEILRNMHDEPPQQMPQIQQPQQMTNQQQRFIPPPAVQSIKPQGYVMQPMQQMPEQLNYKMKESSLGENQKDIILVLVLCVIIYSDQFQIALQRVLPSLFRSEKLSAIGTIACATMVAGTFMLSKHISFNF